MGTVHRAKQRDIDLLGRVKTKGGKLSVLGSTRVTGVHAQEQGVGPSTTPIWKTLLFIIM